MATPTMNKKVGNTRSVGVKPCHWACNRGAYVKLPFPEVLTRIIPANVIPRKISNDKNLDFIDYRFKSTGIVWLPASDVNLK